jgi:non-ribosomal peptide synthetase component F
VIKLAIRKVKPGEESQLRAWMAQLNSRRPEVLATFKQEGVRHEQAYLIHTADGPILVYAVEALDHDRAAAAYAQSTLPIDLEHKQTMRQVLGDSVPSELLYECQA